MIKEEQRQKKEGLKEIPNYLGLISNTLYRRWLSVILGHKESGPLISPAICRANEMRPDRKYDPGNSNS